jgi:hypothetical protein
MLGARVWAAAERADEAHLDRFTTTSPRNLAGRVAGGVGFRRMPVGGGALAHSGRTSGTAEVTGHAILCCTCLRSGLAEL